MGQFATRVACAGLAVLTAGCFWTAPGHNANRQAYNALERQLTVETVGSLTEAWTVQLDEGEAGDPVTSRHGAFVNDARSVYAINPATGAEAWQHSVAAPRVMGQPFVRSDEVLVGSALSGVAEPGDDAAATTRLDAATGAVSGEFPNAIRALRGPRAFTVGGGWLRFGILQPIWVWVAWVGVRDLDTSEVVHGTHLLAPADDLVAVTQGATLGSDFFYATTFVDDVMLCPLGLMAYELGQETTQCSGTTYPDWHIPESGPAPILSDDEATLYFAGAPRGGASTVKAVDAATGSVLWSGALPSSAPASPSLAEGKLYVPTATGQVVVFDAAGCGSSTCPPLWALSTGTRSSITEQVAIAGGVAYTASADGRLHAFDAAGCAAPPCAPIWSAETGSPITGAPAVSNGRLYVGTRDGRLISYGVAG